MFKPDGISDENAGELFHKIRDISVPDIIIYNADEINDRNSNLKNSGRQKEVPLFQSNDYLLTKKLT